ncbi:MAG: TetR/AcrR family transcriptional regulator [Mycetocola sp.]
MDARARRTLAALTEATLRLAAEQPIDRVTVVDLTAAAGVSRRTLYNHAESPQQILTQVLSAELTQISSEFGGEIARGVSRGEAWAHGDDRLAAHVLARADVYGAGITATERHMSPSLAHMISDEFEAGALSVLAEHPDLSDARARITARFIGVGIVGAIEAWLVTPDRDPSLLSEAIASSIAGWITGIQRPGPESALEPRDPAPLSH